MSVDLSLRKTKTKLEEWKSKTEFDNKNYGWNSDYPEDDIKDPEIFWWNGNHNQNIEEFFENLPGSKRGAELVFLTDDDIEEFEFYVEELQNQAKNCKGVMEAIKKAKEEGFNVFYKRT